jgi:hypothetical protein
MSKFHPQLAPQLKFATPLPLELRELIVKVCPEVTLPSVHGEPVVKCPVSAALVAVPEEFSVNVTT